MGVVSLNFACASLGEEDMPTKVTSAYTIGTLACSSVGEALSRITESSAASGALTSMEGFRSVKRSYLVTRSFTHTSFKLKSRTGLSCSTFGMERGWGLSKADFDIDGLAYSMPLSLPMHELSIHFSSSTTMLVDVALAKTLVNSPF